MNFKMQKLCWFPLVALILLALTACSGLATTPSPTSDTTEPVETPFLTTTAEPPESPVPATPHFTRTPLPPSPTPTPESTPDSRPRTYIYDNVKISLLANQQESSKTDVCVEDLTTWEKVLCVTISDVYVAHYHSNEYHDGALYVIRRVGYIPGQEDSNEWTDELWKYDTDGKGINLYSAQGLDFRVAPDEKYIALHISDAKPTWEKLVFLDSSGNLVQEFPADQLVAHDEKVHAPLPAYLSLLKWSDNGSEFWGVVNAGPSPQTIYTINTDSWQPTLYDISGLAIPREFDLNANTGKLVYSDCPQIYVADDAEEFAGSQQQVTLFVHDLDGRNTQVIATAVAKCFRPRWLDDDTIEYNNPDGDDRVMYTVR